MKRLSILCSCLLATHLLAQTTTLPKTTRLPGTTTIAGGVSNIQAVRLASGVNFCFNAATCTVPISGSQPTGTLILAAVGWNSATSTVAITDDCNTGGSSDTYTVLNSVVGPPPTTGSGKHAWARLGESHATCTVTFTQTGGPVSLGVTVDFVNDGGAVGVDAATAQGQDAPGTGANAVTSGNITTVAANEYIWSWTVDIGANGGTLTAGTSPVTYTVRDTQASFPTGDEDGTAVSAGTNSGTWTYTQGTLGHMVTGVIAVRNH